MRNANLRWYGAMVVIAVLAVVSLVLVVKPTRNYSRLAIGMTRAEAFALVGDLEAARADRERDKRRHGLISGIATTVKSPTTTFWYGEGRLIGQWDCHLTFDTNSMLVGLSRRWRWKALF